MRAAATILRLALAGLVGLAGLSGGQARAATRAASGQAGILRVAAQGVADFVTLDPAINTDYSSELPISMIYQGLVKLQINRDGSFGRVVGDLAQSWEVSRDGLVYTFHLKPNQRFSDGTTVTAQDFVYSTTRSLSPKLIGGNGFFYFLPIKGALRYYLGRADSVEGLRALDARTFQITLLRPTAYFLQELTWTINDAVERRVVERYGDSWTDHGAGSGPFMIKSVEHKVGMTLVPNPYWAGGRVGLREVDIPLILSSDTAYNAYQTRQIDILGVGPQGIPARLFATLQRDPRFHVAPGMTTDGIDISQKNTPFTNTHLRRAFALAINKQVIARVLGNSVTPTDGYIAPSIPGFNPGFRGLHYDPAAARREMALAGYPDGRGLRPITFTYYTGATAVADEAQALQQLWQQILGARIVLKPTELGALIQGLISRDFDLSLSQAASVYPDPHTSVFALESTSGFWRDQTFDAMTAQADGTVGNDAARYRIYQRAENYVAPLAPWIPLDVVREGIMIDPRIHGLTAITFGVATNDWSQVRAD